MISSAWQIDKIRKRLDDYRVRESPRAGCLLSIQAVLERMRECPALDESLFREDDAFRLKNEAIRRFANGDSIPRPETIDALRRFLIHESVLAQEELEDDLGDRGEMLAIRGYLEDGSAPARSRMRVIAQGRYLPAEDESVGERVVLHLELDVSAVFFRAEEHVLELAQAPGPGTNEQARIERQYVRRGYGFIATRSHLLHIFLRGASARDRVNYFEVEGFEPSRRLVLMRAGSLKRQPVTQHRRRRIPKTARKFGVQEFMHCEKARSRLTG